MTALVAEVSRPAERTELGAASERRTESRFAVLAGTLAHELKNPLASAVTNLAVAKEFCDDCDPVAPFLSQVDHELDRIHSILRSLMHLACAERVERQEVDVSELLASLASDDVSVECHVHRSAALDAALVRRAIQNILENARRVIESGRATRVELLAERVDADLVLTIRDDGPGVPPELRDQIFDALVSGASGSGLGLSIVRRVCRAHGGEARLVPGRGLGMAGASFELRFGDAFPRAGA